MFYFVVGLVIIGYLIYSGLKRITRKRLLASCPCVLVITIAGIVSFFGIYLIVITLTAIKNLPAQQQTTEIRTTSQIQ
jgi:predicted PurR-regulated permease PerM